MNNNGNLFFYQKQDEQNPLASTNQSEMDNELLINLVTSASTAMMTRLQSKKNFFVLYFI